jgi:hypothetical protein
VHEQAGRFGGFAVLPVSDLEQARAETIRALDELRLDGVGLLSSYDGRCSAATGHLPHACMRPTATPQPVLREVLGGEEFEAVERASALAQFGHPGGGQALPRH